MLYLPYVLYTVRFKTYYRFMQPRYNTLPAYVHLVLEKCNTEKRTIGGKYLNNIAARTRTSYPYFHFVVAFVHILYNWTCVVDTLPGTRTWLELVRDCCFSLASRYEIACRVYPAWDCSPNFEIVRCKFYFYGLESTKTCRQKRYSRIQNFARSYVG